MPRRLTEKKLVLASHNRGKLAEIAALLAPFGKEVVGAPALGLPEPAETEDSFAGNAALKARAAARGAQLPALADDSGFCVAALGGAPGVHTADWASQPDGSRDYAKAMAAVWARMLEQDGAADRHAWFVCALALAWPGGHVEAYEGRVAGHAVWPPRGANGFGFDPMFVPDGHEQTFGEMAPAAKHAISHRADAFARLVAGSLG
ncbi:MAG: non-canonical purine NTP pyrophosphatase [Alphaproteobacteria bacterium]|nr:non-canonical purine NTP pyrophosphatase [Alphaproteobacteria bacterium]